MSSQSTLLDLSLSLCLHSYGNNSHHASSSTNATAEALHVNGANVHLPSSSTSTIELSRGNSSSSTTTTSSDNTKSNNQRAHKVMNDTEREDCINLLLSKQTDLKLPPGAVSELAVQFGVSRWTIQRLWNAVKRLIAMKKHISVTCNFKGKVGKKRIQLDYDKLMNVPLRRRKTVRALAAAMNINKSTVHRFIKWGQIKRHSNAMKPGLTPLNKVQRLKWCIQRIIPESIKTIPKFEYLYNMVHVDEKWFFMSQATQNFYLAPNELQPYRSCKHKSHINKVMFIVAVARPRFSDEGDEIFDGKIGVFPLVTREAAKRSSKNREAGTIETKPIKKITQTVIKKKFIEEIIPAIKAKWPIDASGTIWVQLDNATPHMGLADDAFNQAAHSDGFDIHLLPQPPNSPDLNANDLGFLRAIQSIQHQVAPKTTDELVSAVEHAFEVFDSKLLNYVFLTFQYCMLEIIKVRGGNNYNIPHYGKARMEREGNLPKTVEVPRQLVYESSMDMLKQFLALQNAEKRAENDADDGEILEDDNIIDAEIHEDEDYTSPIYYTSVPDDETEDQYMHIEPEEYHVLEEDAMQNHENYDVESVSVVQELDLLSNFT